MKYSDVEALIAQGTPEDLHLEYKSGRPQNRDRFKADIAQDMSAFANSDGGKIIIGVSESKNVPSGIDGVDLVTLNREALGNVATSRITPNIPGLEIAELHGPEGKDVLVITIARSDTAPHQGPNHTYYRRHQHHIQPLAHFEIEDLRLRQVSIAPLVTVRTATRGSTLSAVDILNTGQHPAEDLKFEFSSPSLWEGGQVPDPLLNGIRHLGPGQRLRFRSQSFSKLLAAGSPPAIFDVRVEYTHTKLLRRMHEKWCLDFEAYRGSMSVVTDEQQLQQSAGKELELTRRAIEDVARTLKETARLVGGNGLDLSLYTLRNLRAIVSGEPIEKLSARYWSAEALQSTLNIDSELALKLQRIFEQEILTRKELREIDGMTDEILARLEQSFEILGVG